MHYLSKREVFEPQYFTLRTFKKYGNFSVKNVLKISPKLRLSALINFVLIKKRVYVQDIEGEKCIADTADKLVSRD